MAEQQRTIADWFDELVMLDSATRVARMRSIEPVLAARLRALLDADGLEDVAIERSIVIDAQHAIAPDLAGTRIGPWRVLGELGSGGMGTVLLAEREQADFVQKVAIKLIRGFPSQDGMRRLRQERQILATLDHPNIARLIDGGETEAGQPFLVVEYVRGQTLDTYVRATLPDRDARLQLIEQIGAAVQHAHQNLVIHRDLKPANVMIGDDGQIKLLDFGVAKLMDIGSDGGSASTRVFTPGFASPEQRAGQAIGIASDIYSLGMMLREVLAIGTPSIVVDAELAGIIAKATAELPAQRYATIDALCDDLRRFRLGMPIAAAADTSWYRARKFIARHRIATVLTGLALAVIAVLIVYLAAALQSAREQRVAADDSRVQAERSLQRATSVVEFFGEMFDGVAPEHALGKSLAPAELLARAERLLRDKPPADASLRSDLSTMLGGLYQRLGDGANAVRLLEQGIAGVTPTTRADALELALRHITLSRALFSVERKDEGLTEIERAVQLRAPYAATDISLQIESWLELAHVHMLMGDLPAARRELASARAISADASIAPDTLLNLEDITAMVTLQETRFDDTISAAHAGLALLDRYPELQRTRVIQLERVLARALQANGRMTEAEAAFARAIAAQEQWVGGGARAGSLYNDYGVFLAALGRSRDSVAAYRHGAELMRAAGAPPPDRNPGYLNNLCDAETGSGEYAEALVHCRAAFSLHASDPPDHPDRMIVESNLARLMALTGSAPQALRQLISLRDIAARSAGAETFPVALHTVRAVRAALIADDVGSAKRLGDEGVRLFATLFASPHPWRARALRFRALALIASGELDAAENDLQAAHSEAIAALPAGHPLIAQIELDRADIAERRGDLPSARKLIASALPPLRLCCTINEVDRARAETIAERLQKN